MDSDELVDTLEAAGLSPYQAAAYVSLLEYSTISATELAHASGVPKPRIYDVVDALEERDYAETYVTDSLHTRAHSAVAVTEDLRNLATRFETAADEIEERWNQPRLDGNRASIVRRSGTVYERAMRFVESAEYQLHLSLTPEEFEQFRDRLSDAHARGVSVRLSLHTEPDEPAPEQSFDDVCLEARHRTFPGPFVVLADRAKTCFVQHPDAVDEYGIVVDGRTHAHVFHWYFRTCLWEGWEPVYSVANTGAPVEYLDIRQCVREVGPLVEAGAAVRVRINGYDTQSGEPCEVDGVVTETSHSGPDEPTLVGQFAGKVSLTVDTGTETRTVGGWGAMLEAIEATHITVTDVTDPDGKRVDTALSSR